MTKDVDSALSYRILRRIVGCLGAGLPVLLPVVCLVFGECSGLKPSISHYDEDPVAGDVFVGALFTIGAFLFAYRGYDWKDNVAGHCACVFALGVALFPTTSPTQWVETAHLVFAALLFATLTIFAGYLFTKTGGAPTRLKLRRNKLYRTCALVMAACLIALVVTFCTVDETVVEEGKLVFWYEALALFAFGVSWFVKGETLWRDPT
ncbi:MAG: DUF998 domain-containing protein [Planctomycetota bacterium]|nr:DUF998 domain-containing protein [Planctomycetota bacterium]